MSQDNSKHGGGVFAITMNLTCACLISGFIIASVNYLTADIAAKKQVELEQLALRRLVPEADSFKPVPGKAGWIEAYKGEALIAHIVPAVGKGYGGKLKLDVSVSVKGEVLNVCILESHETPGLGDRASEPAFHDQFAGKRLGQLDVVKDPADKEHILAITGATITSVGVTNAVRQAVEQADAYYKIKE